jgi:CHAD domain-containing protein
VKRARYAAELIGPLDDSGEAKRTMKRYKKIQTVLGEHQDGVVAAATLRRLGALAGTAPGENGASLSVCSMQTNNTRPTGHGLWQPP